MRVVIPVGKQRRPGESKERNGRHGPFRIRFSAPLSRLFIFLDEIENVPGRWGDVDNILSQIEEEGKVGNFKSAVPTIRAISGMKSENAEPPFGWESFDVDNHSR